MSKWLRMAAAALTLSLVTSPACAETPTTKIRFTLDWKIQGIHAWFYWAKAKGYFKAENLDVTIDQGEGSAATVTRSRISTSSVSLWKRKQSRPSSLAR